MKHIVIVFALLVFLGVALFRDIPSLYFFSDDFVWLLEAKHHSFNDISKYLYQSEGFFYRPTTKIYFWGMWQLVGAEPLWYHLVNLLLHFLVSLVLYLFTLRFVRIFFIVGSSHQFIVSVGAALLFLVHPVHLENIIWPSAITELIPALCVLLILYVLLYYFERPRYYLLLVSLVLFVIGLGAHEYVIVAPGLVFITHMLFIALRKVQSDRLVVSILSALRSHALLYVSYILLGVIYLIVRAFSQAHWSGGDYSYNLLRLPFNFFGNLLGYIGLLIVGIPFIDWYFQLRGYFRSQILVSLGVFTSAFLVLFLSIRRFSAYSNTRGFALTLYFVVFFIITLLPFLGLGGLAERYLYLASVGPIVLFCIAVYYFARAIEKYTESVSIFTCFSILVGVLISYYSYAIVQDQEDWQIASTITSSRMTEFKELCDTFEENVTLVRSSPINRYERAWVFQVGYEEGANVYCDKNIRILRK